MNISKFLKTLKLKDKLYLNMLVLIKSVIVKMQVINIKMWKHHLFYSIVFSRNE